MKKNYDSYEDMKEIFDECKLICNPIGNFRVIPEIRLNPAVNTSILFLCEIVKSFDINLIKENFKLLWKDFFYVYINNGLSINSIYKIDEYVFTQIFEMESRINDNFKNFRVGQGLENFLEEKYEIFLKEAKSQRKTWLEKTKNSKNYNCYDCEDFGNWNEILN